MKNHTRNNSGRINPKAHRGRQRSRRFRIPAKTHAVWMLGPDQQWIKEDNYSELDAYVMMLSLKLSNYGTRYCVTRVGESPSEPAKRRAPLSTAELKEALCG